MEGAKLKGCRGLFYRNKKRITKKPKNRIGTECGYMRAIGSD